jgi:uncharacterized protein YkwD
VALYREKSGISIRELLRYSVEPPKLTYLRGSHNNTRKEFPMVRPVTEAELVEYEKYMFDLINKSRAAGRPPLYSPLPPYIWNASLGNVARAHSKLNLMKNPSEGCQNRHVCNADGEFNEPDWYTRIQNAVGGLPAAAENIHRTPNPNPLAGLDIIHQAFMVEGPGSGSAHIHYENIMSSTLQQVGVGVAYDGIHIWVTEDFIKP